MSELKNDAVKGNEYTSDEIIEIKCSVCVGKNTTRKAEKYCVECQDYYCIPCSNMHRSFPALRSHKLLEKSDFCTHGTLSSLPSYPTERCSIHKAKLLDIFCEDHDEVVCTTCATINHRSCQSIHSISDNIETIHMQHVLDKTTAELIEEERQFEDIKHKKQHLLCELEKEKQTAIESIVGYKKDLEAELKRLENESIKQVEAKYGSLRRNLQDTIKESDEYIEELEQSDKKIQNSQGNKAQEFVSVKAAQKIIRLAGESKKLLASSVTGHILFAEDTNIKHFLKQLNVLGNVSVTETNERSIVKTVKQFSFNAGMKSDKLPSRLFSSCILEDGSLIITDIDNKKLKRIDTSKYTITDNLILEDVPIAVCQTGKEEVAVSLHNRCIAFVSIGNKMAITRKLKMEHYCCGLAYKEDQLFISDEKKCSIYT